MSDYISREALKEAFDNADADVCESYPDGYCNWGFGRKNINDVIDGVPAADVEPVRRWIPCSERLPETDGPYLVANKATGWIGVYNFSRAKNFLYFGPQRNAWWRLDDDWYPQSCNVTHWMPEPGPPKEETGK